MSRVFAALLLYCICIFPVQAVELSDPTRPAWYKGVVMEDDGMVVSSILVSPSRKIAVINGQTVKIGDLVNNFQVLDITNNGVSLKGPEESFDLPLHAVRIKATTIHNNAQLIDNKDA